MDYITTVDVSATGKNIINLRKENNMTVRQLQEVFGFSTPQAIYNWQRGRDLPTIDNLAILATVFEVTLDEIVVIKTGPC